MSAKIRLDICQDNQHSNFWDLSYYLSISMWWMDFFLFVTNMKLITFRFTSFRVNCNCSLFVISRCAEFKHKTEGLYPLPAPLLRGWEWLCPPSSMTLGVRLTTLRDTLLYTPAPTRESVTGAGDGDGWFMLGLATEQQQSMVQPTLHSTAGWALSSCPWVPITDDA